MGDQHRPAFRVLVESCPTCAWVSDRHGRLVYVSPAIQNIAGYLPEELIADLRLAGRALHCGVSTKDGADPAAGSKGVFHIVHRDGTDRWISATRLPREQEGGMCVGYVSDLTGQMLAMESAAIDAQCAERARLSRLLHGHVQQLLVSARIHLNVLSARIEGDTRQIAETIAAIIEEAIGCVRSLSARLELPEAIRRGLRAALLWLVDHVRHTQMLDVEARIADDLDAPAPALSAMVCESVRELLLNVAKHAACRRAWVEAFSGAGTLRVTVGDDGRGFDTRGVGTEPKGPELAMVERDFKAVGGDMRVPVPRKEEPVLAWRARCARATCARKRLDRAASVVYKHPFVPVRSEHAQCANSHGQESRKTEGSQLARTGPQTVAKTARP